MKKLGEIIDGALIVVGVICAFALIEAVAIVFNLV